MPMPVRCEACGYSRNVPDEFAGRQGKCPKCGGMVKVPRPAEGSHPPRGAAPAQSVAPSVPSASPHAPPQKPVVPPPPQRDRDEAAVAANTGATPLDYLSPDANDPNSAGASDETAIAADWLADAAPSAAATSSSRKRGGSRASKAAPRGKRGQPTKGVPLWAIAVGIGGVLILLGSIGYWAMSGGDSPKVASKKNKASLTASSDKSKKPADEFPSFADKAKKEVRPPADAPLEDIFAWIKPGIVVIEVSDKNQPIGLGSGFVVDDSGLIATNYHVIGPGDSATVRFTDGTQYEVAGYAALKPEWDLAILQLKQAPAHPRVLKLVHDGRPREASRVFAVGSPLGREFVPSSGIVSRIVQANDLEASKRAFLMRQTGFDEQFWIEHDAQIAPGNSGGPLFNQAGDVIGVNTWVDINQFGHNGYAIWAWYVYDLIGKRLPQAEPLAKHQQKEETPTVLAAGVTVEKLEAAFQAMEAANWNSTDDAAKETLQAFATALCVASSASKIGLPDKLEVKAKEIVTKLAKKTWSAADQLRGFNEQAQSAFAKPGTGCCAYGTIQQKQTQGPLTIVVLEVADGKKPVAAVVLASDTVPEKGDTCLLFGVVAKQKVPYVTPAEGHQEMPLLELAVGVAVQATE